MFFYTYLMQEFQVLGNKSRTNYDFLTETIFILGSPIIKPLSIIFSRFNKSDKFVEN